MYYIIVLVVREKASDILDEARQIRKIHCFKLLLIEQILQE
jgi:hypothetical protein